MTFPLSDDPFEKAPPPNRKGIKKKRHPSPQGGPVQQQGATARQQPAAALHTPAAAANPTPTAAPQPQRPPGSLHEDLLGIVLEPTPQVPGMEHGLQAESIPDTPDLMEHSGSPAQPLASVQPPADPLPPPLHPGQPGTLLNLSNQAKAMPAQPISTSKPSNTSRRSHSENQSQSKPQSDAPFDFVADILKTAVPKPVPAKMKSSESVDTSLGRRPATKTHGSASHQRHLSADMPAQGQGRGPAVGQGEGQDENECDVDMEVDGVNEERARRSSSPAY